MTSTRPTQQQLPFEFASEAGRPDATPQLQPEQSSLAAMEKPASNLDSTDLMERIVETGNMERAWKKVKANRGAPGCSGRPRVSRKSLKKFKRRTGDILNCNRGVSMPRRLKELRQYLQGWMAYFAIDPHKTLSREIDKWLRRRVRACYRKQWRLPRVRVRKLRSLGVPAEEAYSHGNSRKVLGECQRPKRSTKR